MIIFEDLTPAQEKIIQDICYTQLSSLRRIYNNEPLGGQDIVMLLIKNEVNKEDFRNNLELKIESVKKLGNSPNTISNMDKQELSTFKHILFKLEHKWEDKYPQAIKNLWRKLFIVEDFKNTNLSSIN